MSETLERRLRIAVVLAIVVDEAHRAAENDRVGSSTGVVTCPGAQHAQVQLTMSV
jgi:hypothetical protein